MVYPIPHILIGCAFAELWRLGETRGWIKRGLFQLSPCLCIAVLLASQVVIDARYIRSFQILGGVGTWSDAIYSLARYAESRPIKTFLLMDWGFNNQLLLLTHAKIKKTEAFVAIKDAVGEEKHERLKPLLRQPNAILVFHAPQFESFPLLELFFRSLEKEGLKANLIQTFSQRDGQPVYLLYEIPTID